MAANPCKPSVYLDAQTWDEIDAVAAHYEASRSWVVQQAWKLARGEIAAFPDAPSKRALQALQARQPAQAPTPARPSQALPRPAPADLRAPTAPPTPAPSQALPRPPASPPDVPPAWEVRLRRPVDPLDSQERERPRWSDGEVGEPTL